MKGNEIEINNIVVKNNPRKDFGDIDELTASIKEKGVLEPILLKDLGDGKAELIAGERRLRSAKAAGHKTIKYVFYEGDDTEIEEVKLIENMHRKDLNPIEEGIAFKNYIKTTKKSIDYLSQKISKPKLYIERRIELLKLPDEVHKALAQGKILIGHAMILSRMDKDKDKVKVLKKLLREKWNVSDTESHMRHEDSTVMLNNAVFDKSECKGCKHNGGNQSVLFDTGAELKGLCLKSKCYFQKTREWKKEETKQLEKKGVKVLSPANLEKLKVKEKVNDWDDDHKTILKKLHKEPENYAVVFDEDYNGNPEKEIYCLNPKARRPKNTTQSQTTEKEKNQNAQNKLMNKIASFKTDFLISKTQELMKPSTKETKALSLFALLNEGLSWNDRTRKEATEKLIKGEKVGKENYGGMEPVFSKILALEDKDIDRLTSTISGLWVKNLHDDLSKASKTFGVNLNEHFTITEDYLNLHTKDQLINLTNEIGLNKHLEKTDNKKWEKGKRTELISYFLNNGFDLKGKIPKSLSKAK